MGKVIASIVAGFVVLFALGIVFGSWYTIGAGEQGVLTQMGAVQETVGPGLHFKIPFAQGIDTISTRIRTVEWSGDQRMEAYSKDQQPAKISVKVAWHINADANSIKAIYTQYKDEDGFANSMVLPRTFEAVKNVFGGFDAVTAIQERARFNAEVESSIRSLVPPLVTIDGVQIQDVTFSDDYEKAVEARMQAQVNVEKKEQDKRTKQLDADMQVIAAEAQAKATKLAGEAEASAIRMRGDALRDNPKLVALTAAERWDGALPTTMVPGSTVPFLSVSGGDNN